MNDEVFEENKPETILIGENKFELTVLRIWYYVGGTCYKVQSVGISPNFPVAGRVVIEAIIEKGGGAGSGGSNAEPY